jgi:diguanylate cyclase (GGDEF)-like protein/PAS domain S-box-containing protein
MDPITVAAPDLLDHLPDAVVVVDTSGVLAWGNAAASRMFGRTLDESIGISAFDFIHPDDLDMALVSLSSMVDRDVGSPLELRVRGVDGWRLVEMVGATRGDLVTLVLRDLTERRRWEVAGDEVAQFRAILQNGAAVILLLDGNGVVRSSSAGLTRLLGLDQAWLEGRPLTDLADGAERELLRSALRPLLDPGPTTGMRHSEVDVHLRCADGETLPASVTFADLLDDPTVEGIVVTLHDITRRVRAEEELREANSVLAATLDATAEGVVVVDADGLMTSCNRQFAQMWHIPDELLEAGSDGQMLAHVLKYLKNPDGFLARVQELYSHPDAESHDLVEFLDGRVFERDSRPQRVDGQVIGRVWSFRDVTAHRVLQNELARQASHDPLTGLANQVLFRDRVAAAVSGLDPGDDRLAVLFIDLDDFKTVNDSLGHSAGDHLLISVSERLRRCVRSQDVVARLGGDEFAVLVSHLGDEEEATEIASRMLRVLGDPLTVAGRPMSAGASVGIAYGRSGDSVDDLLRNADLAMYVAKNSGRSQFRIYEPHMHHAALRRLEVDSGLRGASGRGELVVHYQPIVDMESGRIRAFEALVRWSHPEHGVLMPVDFVPFAEESGLIDEIGQFVLVQACEQAREWGLVLGEALAPAITVNVSPRQLLDERLPDRVRDVLAHTGVEPSRLVLEITEGALMQDPDTATRRLEHLTRVGVRLAVDDFGTGHSSLSHLRRFPIDLLKVDRSFVNEVEEHTGESLVWAIVQLAHTLGMSTVAEGVETVGQRDRLAELRCDLAQGYLYARPMDAGSAMALIRSAGVRSGGGR